MVRDNNGPVGMMLVCVGFFCYYLCFGLLWEFVSRFRSFFVSLRFNFFLIFFSVESAEHLCAIVITP
jgi:hypothetical protein